MITLGKVSVETKGLVSGPTQFDANPQKRVPLNCIYNVA